MGSRAPHRLVAVSALLLALPLGGLAGCGRDEPVAPGGPLRIATGSRIGVYFAYGQAIATLVQQRLPQLQPSVLETDGSEDNVRKVAANAAEVGFTQADLAADTLNTGASVVALARLYDDYLHLVVRADSSINNLDSLRGKRVSVGAVRSGTVVAATRLLRIAALAPERDLVTQKLNLDDSTAALRAGQIDAFFFSGGLPVSGIKALAAAMPIRLVDLGGFAAQLRRAHGPYYAEHAVPASTYDLPDVTTVGIPNYLVVPPQMPAATAYALTRTIFNGGPTLAAAHPVAERLNIREAINTYPLALHPGAEHYYRDIKR